VVVVVVDVVAGVTVVLVAVVVMVMRVMVKRGMMVTRGATAVTTTLTKKGEGMRRMCIDRL